jgi:signal transduction histidine kinase
VVRAYLGRRSLEWKLPIAICSVLLVLLGTLAWVAYLDVRRTETSSAGLRLEGLAQQFSSELRGEAPKAVAEVRRQAQNPDLRAYLRSPSEATRSAALTALRPGGTDAGRVAANELRDPNGAQLLVGGRDTVHSSAIPVVALTLVGPSSDSGAMGPFLALGDSVALPAVVPVLDHGVRLGYLIQWRYVTASRSERDATLALVGPGSGMYLGSVTGGVWTDRTAVVPPPPIDVSRLAGFTRYQRPGHGWRIAAAAAVPGTPWLVLIEFSEGVVLAPAHRFLVRVAVIALVLFFLGLLGVWLMIRRLTEPMRQLTDAAEGISTGDYSGRVKVHGRDELARLGTTFNLMAERVEDTHQKLEDKVVELRSTQEKFAHAQRMEAVGRLAGGIAHDFNNILTVILGETDLAIATESGEDTKQSFLEIRKAGERAAILTRQLLAFSRRQLIEPTVFSLNELIADLDKMLGRLIGEDIELVSRTDAEEPAVRADRGQIEQVVMNLVVNARDAMPRGGRLVIETANVTLDEEYVRTRADVAPGPYVMIAVSDTGSGMTDDVKAHIFEPFFTTKDRSKGTGLGLATCYGIVKQSGGHIVAYTEIDVGTTMRVYLPAAGKEAEVARSPAASPLRGNETILLVEDEVPVRMIAARILEGQGYRVLEATDGEDALSVLEHHPETIHLMMTDVVLPGIGGRELAEQVEATGRGIKILFSSGYTDDVILQHKLVARDVTLLQKPFTASTLSQKVRQVLDSN